MRCPSKISQNAWRLLLSLVIISKISDANRCPDEQVEHVIPETSELRCCYPLTVDIDHEFVMCSVNGSRDTQRPCGQGLNQPDQTSSEHEPHCISEFLNCNSYDTKIVQDGADMKCICNLDGGFCGLDKLQCKEIRSINCAGYKVDQSCTCILPSTLPPITQDSYRTEVMKTTKRVVNITSLQLPTKEEPWTDGKTTEEPYSREHDVNNTVNNDDSSNSNNNLSIVLPSVLVPCLILGLLGLLLFCICRRRRSNIRQSAVYSPLRKGKRNDSEAGLRGEEVSTQRLRRQDSKVPVQSSSTSSINNTYEDLRTFRREGKEQLTAVVRPCPVSDTPARVQDPASSASDTSARVQDPACPVSDTPARVQDPANLTSVHTVEEWPGPVFHNNIPYTPLCPESLESSGMDRIIRVPQSSESSVTQQTGLASELVQSRAVSLIQERREVTPVGASTARRASDFGHNTTVKEYGTNSGPIQELTNGKGTTFHGAGEVRAELPVIVPYLDGRTQRDSEDTELKEEETAVKCSQKTGVVMDGTDVPFTNELMAKTDGASNTSILDLSNVVNDPSGVCPEERNEEINCQNPFPSNFFEALGNPNLLASMSADSLFQTDSDEDDRYE